LDSECIERVWYQGAMSTAGEWIALRNALESLRHSVGEEIRAYPAPIPACDAQFNRLLELRRLLPDEIERVAAASVGAAASVEAFLRESPCAAEVKAALKL
jgi:hypothetical protein